MKILESSNIVKVGNFNLNGRKVKTNKYIKYEKTLGFEWDSKMTEKFKTKVLTIVYFIVVDDDIYKIGMTMGKGGIKSCLNFYLNAGTDDPGFNRFTINWLLRNELKKEKKVEVYMFWQEPIITKVKTIFSQVEVEILIDGKVLEKNCKEEYKLIHGKYPKWNYQENGEVIDKYISDEFSDYKLRRKKIK